MKLRTISQEPEGRWEGIIGGRVFRNNYKGHLDKTTLGWKQGREVGLDGVGGTGRG